MAIQSGYVRRRKQLELVRRGRMSGHRHEEKEIHGENESKTRPV